jgi:hypothetical protein
LIQTYVAAGFGVGLSVQVPKATVSPEIRLIPLPRPDFAPVVVGALWRGKPSSLVAAFLEEVRLRAKRLS